MRNDDWAGRGVRPPGVRSRFKARTMLATIALGGAAAMGAASSADAAITCARTVTANVVVLDQALVWNRLGASTVNGMMFALRRDVIFNNRGNPTDPNNGRPLTQVNLTAAQLLGNVELRPDKRPRPLVLRVAAGDCLDVNFQNLFAPAANPKNVLQQQTAPVIPGGLDGAGNPALNIDEQVFERRASFHAAGLQLRNSIADDGSNVGRNVSSLVSPGQSTTYHLFAEREGAFILTSRAADVGSDGNQGNSTNGLFGQVIVEPARARIYRSVVNEEEMRLATTGVNANGTPRLNYEARYPNTAIWQAEGKARLPVLNTICPAGGIAGACGPNEIVHSEIDGMIAGPNANGTFPATTYPHETAGRRNPAYPNRLEAFRDFASMFHDEVAAAQAYPGFYKAGFRAPGGGVDPLTDVFAYILKGVRDGFMINYGSGGIGTEILSNRLGVGPMHDCLDCAYEEFFLTTFTVGDVGQVVDVPANFGLETLTPGRALELVKNVATGAPDPLKAFLGPKAHMALYPGDPSNVHHSYTGDFVKFRNTHIGFEQHVFHLHNHQWLFNPNDDNSNYLDAQGIGPGMGYTYEIANGGSGNRNKSSGDAIFHCHFYPHFAQGMWYMWRNHDVTEVGTKLQVSGNTFHNVRWALQDGTPATGARAQPDGEISVGAPIPAIVPLPGKAMAPMPAAVTVRSVDRDGDGAPDSSQASVNYADVAGPDGKFGTADDKNPGYPFWIAGVACGPASRDPECFEGIVGQRPTTPPMDMLNAAQAQALKAAADAAPAGDPLKMFVNVDPRQVDGWDGGLPRHGLLGVKSGGAAGPTPAGTISAVDLGKQIEKARPVYFDEVGTELERTAMFFHSVRQHASFANQTNNTQVAANFVLNGRPPMPGAPFSDPCVDDQGAPTTAGSVRQFNGPALGTFFPGQIGVFGADNPRVYKGANMQYDAVINKVGYHYPQQRIVALWQDVVPTIEKQRPGEPLVMRLNTFDCAMYHHTNLVPAEYELDDYQVRTPTDIIGQHIHLPKWDLTTTDGAANGWNYEDGTLSYGAVRERIHAINNWNAERTAAGEPTVGPLLEPAKHPFFPATGPGGVDWTGARTTMQRWFADPLYNVAGVDRGLGIIFTHDHYGPSSFQQIGLYSTVLIEPAGSAWKHAETGNQLGYDPTNGAAARSYTDDNNRTQSDGGPTSWQAAIVTAPSAGAARTTGDLDGDGKDDSYREFYFEYSDFQHAYEAGVYVGAGPFGQPAAHAANPDAGPIGVPGAGVPAVIQTTFAATPESFRFAIAPPHILPKAPIFPDLTFEAAGDLARGALAPTPCPTRPCPTSIDFLEPGTFVVNYRQESVALRVFDPNKLGPDGVRGAQADGLAGDLSHAFRSNVQRVIPELNVMPTQATSIASPVGVDFNDPAVAPFIAGITLEPTTFPPHINASGFEPGDPFTPMMRTYSGDRIRIKAQAGGDEEEHSISIHGMKWLQAGSGFGRAPNSGWKNHQAGGISEQFTFASPVFMDFSQTGNTADYLYTVDATQDGYWQGMWGLMRNYNTLRSDLYALPNNVRPVQPVNRVAFQGGDRAVCPRLGPQGPTPLKTFDVTAVLANDVLPPVAGVSILPDVNALFLAAGQTAPAGVTLANLSAGALPNAAGGTLVYNPRADVVEGNFNIGLEGEPVQIVNFRQQGPLHEPTAMMYVMTSDLANPADPKQGLKPGVPVEPLVLRVNAGDCVEVTLRNGLPAVAPDLPNFNEVRHVVKRERFVPEGSTTFQVNLLRPSTDVGFRMQLLESDVTRSGGENVGFNPVQTVASGGAPKTYTFYAGDLRLAETPQIGDPNRFNLDLVLATPIEFGGANIMPSDLIKQGNKGLYGQVIVEPRGATVTPDPSGSRISATVNATVDGRAQTYRDYAMVWQKMLNYRYASGVPVANINGEGPGLPENPPHVTLAGANYLADPVWFRLGLPPQAFFGGAGCRGELGATVELACFGNPPKPAGDAWSNSVIGGLDPSVPIFTAPAGSPFRIHVTNPQSTSRGTTWTLHGHVWPRDPYLAASVDARGFPTTADVSNVGSVRIGNNPMQMYLGAQESIIGASHWSFVMPSAGGGNAVTGDYLIMDMAGAGKPNGAWGLFRVQ